MKVGHLVSILMPSLMNARYRAIAAVCLSNARQNYTATQLFFKNNDQKMPNRYRRVQPQDHRYSYVSGEYTLLGQIWKDEYIYKTGETFFCPQANLTAPLKHTYKFSLDDQGVYRPENFTVSLLFLGVSLNSTKFNVSAHYFCYIMWLFC